MVRPFYREYVFKLERLWDKWFKKKHPGNETTWIDSLDTESNNRVDDTPKDKYRFGNNEYEFEDINGTTTLKFHKGRCD